MLIPPFDIFCTLKLGNSSRVHSLVGRVGWLIFCGEKRRENTRFVYFCFEAL